MSQGDLLLSLVFPQIDRAAVTRASANQTANPNFWRQKLEERSFVFPSLFPANVYRPLYIQLYTHSFNIDETYLSACEQNMAEIVAYLSKYISSPSLGKSCVLSTTSKEVIQSTQLAQTDVREVLFVTAAKAGELGQDTKQTNTITRETNQVTGEGGSISNKERREEEELKVSKFRQLLLMYGADQIAGDLIGLAPIIVQVEVARLANETTLSYLGNRVSNPEVAAEFERRGYIFPIAQAIDIGALASVRSWLDTDPSEDQIEMAISRTFSLASSSKSIPKPGILSLLIKKGKKSNEKWLVLAAQRDFGDACSEIVSVDPLVPTYGAIVSAIRANALSSCRALSRYTTQAHLRLAKSLGKMSAYNALIPD